LLPTVTVIDYLVNPDSVLGQPEIADAIAKLRQVDVLVSQGQNMVDAIRQIGVSEVTYYRWRQEFGGLKTEQVKRLKDLQLEHSRLRKAVSDLTLDKLILQEAARGNF
jgi:transposase-like protein